MSKLHNLRHYTIPKVKGFFMRNNTLMFQALDLRRQLQEAWDKEAYWKDAVRELEDAHSNTVSQLHRVAHERDEERRLRLDAEALLAGNEEE